MWWNSQDNLSCRCYNEFGALRLALEDNSSMAYHCKGGTPEGNLGVLAGDAGDAGVEVELQVKALARAETKIETLAEGGIIRPGCGTVEMLADVVGVPALPLGGQ